MDHQQAELSLREQMNTSALVPYVVTKSGEHIAHGGLNSTCLGQRRSREEVQVKLDEFESGTGVSHDLMQDS